MRDHFEGVVVGNVESGHTKRDAFVKIVNSKWKRLRPHTCRLSVWRTHDQVSGPLQLEDEAFVASDLDCLHV